MRPLGKVAIGVALLIGIPWAWSLIAEDEVTPPIQIGDAPADQPPIDLDVDLNKWGMFKKWPSACDLVTDETLTALLPQTTDVTRTPESSSFDVHTLDSIVPEGGISVSEARCNIELDIPVGSLNSEASVGTSLFIEVLMAGTPGMVELNTSFSHDEPLDLDGGTCYDSGGLGLSCVNATKQVAFRVNFQMAYHALGVDDPSRYVHDGDVASFANGTDKKERERIAEKRRAYLDEHVVYPVLESILARMAG